MLGLLLLLVLSLSLRGASYDMKPHLARGITFLSPLVHTCVIADDVDTLDTPDMLHPTVIGDGMECLCLLWEALILTL